MGVSLNGEIVKGQREVDIHDCVMPHPAQHPNVLRA
jgi:hypothetical protein